MKTFIDLNLDFENVVHISDEVFKGLVIGDPLPAST